MQGMSPHPNFQKDLMPIDFADQAQDLSDLILSRTLQNQQLKTSIPFSGLCLSCEEPIEKGRYCDSDCRDDHESRRKRK